MKSPNRNGGSDSFIAEYPLEEQGLERSVPVLQIQTTMAHHEVGRVEIPDNDSISIGDLSSNGVREPIVGHGNGSGVCIVGNPVIQARAPVAPGQEISGKVRYAISPEAVLSAEMLKLKSPEQLDSQVIVEPKIQSPDTETEHVGSLCLSKSPRTEAREDRYDSKILAAAAANIESAPQSASSDTKTQEEPKNHGLAEEAATCHTTRADTTALVIPAFEDRATSNATESFLPGELKMKKIETIKAHLQTLSDEIAHKRTRLNEVTQTLRNPAAAATVARHIHLLHRYNEIRDVGLALFALVAEQRCSGVRELWHEFGLADKD